ncbi:ATP-binding protein [Lactobacillaceae bacterium Scapto_B20]
MALKYQDLLTAANVVINADHVPSIVGDAGIGKSALVEDLAERNQAKLFTTVVSLAEKGDLAIPVPPLTSDSFVQTEHYGRLADVQFGYHHTLIQIIQYAESHPTQPIYWFLDEFNRGSQAVQSELMNLVLQRQINALILPEQVHIIIAENPDASMTGFEDRSYSVMSGDDAIKDRTVRLVLRSDFYDWLDWAREDDHIDPVVISYLTDHPEMLSTKIEGDDIFPTPRAWQRVSDNYRQLMHLDANQRSAIQLEVFAGDLGTQVASAFNEYVQTQQQIGDAKQLFTMPVADASEQFSQLSAVAQVAVIQAGIEQDADWDADFIEHLNAFLPVINEDGQYACGLAMVAHFERLNDLYQKASANQQPFLDLYVLLERIGFASW